MTVQELIESLSPFGEHVPVRIIMDSDFSEGDVCRDLEVTDTMIIGEGFCAVIVVREDDGMH